MDAQPRPHIFTEYDRQFARLLEGVAEMCGHCREAFRLAVDACLKGDLATADRAIALDHQIDHLDKTLGRNGIDILVRFTPTASDLRRVVSSLRVLPNLERIGDESVSIAKRARRAAACGPLPQTVMIEPLAARVGELLGDATLAFSQMNERLAAGIPRRDGAIDALAEDLLLSLAAVLESVPGQNTTRLVDLLFIVRSLERIGDHAKNLAEEVVYVATGADIRHGGDGGQG
jgi:phosphate transport system protein